MILSRAEEEIERIGCDSQLGGAKGRFIDPYQVV